MSANLINQLLPAFLFALFALGFAGFRLYYSKLHSAALFALSYGFAAAAFTAEALVVPMHASYLRFLGDSFYVVSALLFLQATADFYHVRLPLIRASGVAALAIVADAYFRFAEPDVVARIHIITLASATYLLMSAATIWPKRLWKIDHVLAWLLVIFALMLVANSVLTHRVHGESLTVENLHLSVYMAAVNLLVSVISPAIAVALFISYGIVVIRDLENQSMTDPLSGLLNRRGFESRAGELLEKAGRNGQRVSMIIADLDSFKDINDRAGHLAGDAVVRAFAGYISSGIGRKGLAGRIGGDEFCILLPKANESAAIFVAQKLRTQMANWQPDRPDTGVTATVSMGVAEGRLGESLERVFGRADAALFLAKKSGRNQVMAASGKGFPEITGRAQASPDIGESAAGKAA
ncbi:GGDEF domain-containing protein [Salaquimonas pukyongi]|uniref:GGDEF domain-containing protein n=1 Tax=Salaquimonas pukyongi TaxID=2712698 RepID=UPI00096BB9F5|nr:diguanylate cyclase [Salaquimonas pukyongi]